MKDSYLDNRACYIMLATFLPGSLFVFSEILNINTDIWISILIANILIITICFIYTKLLKRFEGKNFFEIIKIIFGKYLGKIFILLYILYAFLVNMLNINSVTNYLKYNDLKESPKLFIALFMAFICIKCILYGFNVLGNWCKFMFPAILIAIFLPTVLSYKIYDFYNFLPIMSSTYSEILINSIYFFCVPLGEIIFFLIVFDYLKDFKCIGKIFSKGIGISLIITLIIYFRNILILGPNLISIINYPTYYSTALIKVSEFFQRFEIFISTLLILGSFVKISICLFFTVIGIRELFDLSSYSEFAFSTMFLIISVSLLLFPTSSTVISLLTVYPFIALPFQVGIPFIMFIIVFIKKWLYEFKHKKIRT